MSLQSLNYLCSTISHRDKMSLYSVKASILPGTTITLLLMSIGLHSKAMHN
ncbi:hypothetical protein SOVF_189810 [Spinacia oleracea]|nr:hypothetical protein SOVF_189810 [Spinacia oleracea]